MSDPANTTYLGDGVYATIEGGELCIWTERDGGKHYIYLEWQAVLKLWDFAEGKV